MRKENLYCGGFYHVYNRGVDKRNLFQDDRDREKFLYGLKKFNEGQLVRVIAFCLMPNHYHMFLQQVSEQGVSKFMQKLGTSYTMYFNKRLDRKGRLFESTFQCVEVFEQSQFLHLSRYIHLNPIDLYQGPFDIKQMMGFLKNYRWSSLRMYLSARLKPGWLDVHQVLDCFNGPNDYENFIQQGLVVKAEPY